MPARVLPVPLLSQLFPSTVQRSPTRIPSPEVPCTKQSLTVLADVAKIPELVFPMALQSLNVQLSIEPNPAPLLPMARQCRTVHSMLILIPVPPFDSAAQPDSSHFWLHRNPSAFPMLEQSVNTVPSAPNNPFPKLAEAKQSRTVQ